ncbi:MAG: tRNA 2-thiocytidine(32) synthetase TtcA [Clostridia bacterium]|nr:tRNA 2-thiocytidine(32) synthetase TtcA [Clostridia bacterium]MBP5236121.1 tRNA 2-thiocytidine(32) synthetase TtcA [Clostridia bacterium]
MKEIKRLLSSVRRAVDDYDMIEDGDVIAVGVSGGKDSLALLCALNELRIFYPKSFSLQAITVDMGFEGMDFAPVRQYCDSIGVEYTIAETQISDIIFNVRKESNPCSLCARMRRGVLYDTAKKCGAGKVALGHNFDDAVETFMLNLFYEGRIGCFSPVTYLSRMEMTMIRPLIYTEEKYIRYFSAKAGLPVVTSTCPEDKNTERENMKKLLRTIERDNKGLRHRIFGAIQRAEIDGFRSETPEK